MATITNQTWTSEAGPIQTKRVEKSLYDFRYASKGVTQISGVKGVNEYRMHLVSFQFGNGTPAMIQESIDFLDNLGNRYGWIITPKNHHKIIAEIKEAHKNIVLPIEDNRRSPEKDSARTEKQQEQAAHAQIERNEQASSWAKIMAKAPANAVAAIVAHEEIDDCDPMTDYYHTKIGRRVVIGFRTGKREDFKQLRKAAGMFEETLHLGVGCDLWTVGCVGPDGRYAQSPDSASYSCVKEVGDAIDRIGDAGEGVKLSGRCESIEHRENYSMGAGNYLKAGDRHGDGWAVRSMAMGPNAPSYVYEDGIE